MKDKHERKTVPIDSYQEDPFRNVGFAMTDPLGSYTRVPIPLDDEPVQDADDL